MPMERASSKKTGLHNQLSSLNLKEGAPVVKRGPGRPSTGAAKKGNPEYTNTTIFLPKQVYADAQAKLIRANAVKDEKLTVSDILSDYLKQWVNE